MNAPGKIEAAVVVDQLELFRLGVERVLLELDVRVVASTLRAGEGIRYARSGAADLLIVGRRSDLKPQHVLRETRKSKKVLKVLFLLEQADMEDVARLVGLGADGLLLRTAKAAELRDAIARIEAGERVIASAIAVGTVGRVGPPEGVEAEQVLTRSGLSPKELEVLAELASGLTYKEIAASLIVTQATVKTHLVHIYAKLGVRNRQEAIARALALGLLA